MSSECIVGDCRDVLTTLPKGGVQMCVTSPPYWGLRDYGVKKQIGLERTPELFVQEMVEVFRLVRDVLADDGTLWLNLGDSYACSGMTGGTRRLEGSAKRLAQKQLIGIPWRVAFALQADGWYLRSDIIWHKPNPLPESVTDRPTKSHEYLFLLTKGPLYYYDATAIQEPSVDAVGVSRGGSLSRFGRSKATFAESLISANALDNLGGEGCEVGAFEGGRGDGPYGAAHRGDKPAVSSGTRNRPCILAGTSERGHCPECGARWVRVVVEQRPSDPAKTTGWRPTCDCNLDPIPDVVLDPFLGAGTTAQVAQHLGRGWIGIDINQAYTPMQEDRTAQQAMCL